MKPSYYYKQIQTLAKENKSLVFWVLIVFVIILDIFVVQHSIRLIIQVKSADVPEPIARGVRVNFIGLNQALESIEANELFRPSEESDVSPFGLVPDGD